jgi:hypothetical protein
MAVNTPGRCASSSAWVIARLLPATPMASKPPRASIRAGVGTDRNSAQRSPLKARTSSASVEPVKSSP